MSVVAIPTRRHPGVRPPARPRTSPTLTITLDLVPGPLSPRLARLVQLLGELAESGEGQLRAVEDPASGPRPAPRPVVPPAAPDHVRILAGSRMVRQGDRVIALTRIEYELLLFLAERPRRVFTRLQLLSSVWGYEHAVARTVDVHVRRLRAKLAGSEVVTTVYGVGYRLADEAPISVDHSS
ncbi:winged helix-turn-helix domain-containing protein [Micromonospora noduli]|uniref:Response regulator MprA n=1 Tax=Micromonospora noduli TaxID=709876 RepID=A0ABX9CRT5_9ACTN|nr:winged helix-turn-helix domain-containing protein [Micromonospora noduli]KAB1915913.1 winged helix-turn-helix transcriptional regulator [Micromonospora noduli]RAO08828.1 Response regulator MprA [Micromonospora noduli]RAO13933.1 Response regulator MprA [Micromonospora noduli]RAO16410.1 Response regulator MprA [Micromonospora noduli]RAO51247.1 Response regulator MprA [Micromonospora noduli]